MADKRIPVFDENLGRTSGNAAGRASGLATGEMRQRSILLTAAHDFQWQVSNRRIQISCQWRAR